MAIRKKLSDNRVNRAIEERDDRNGAKRPGVIDYTALGSISAFKPRDDQSYKLNIIPYTAQNPLNPSVATGLIAVGDLDLWLEVWAHRNIGPDKAFVLCPNKMWGKSCPICDHKSKLYDDGEDDAAKDFQPSKRLIMFVQVFEKGEPQDVQLFEVAHYSFGQPLLSRADKLRKEGKIGNFGDPEDGNLIKFWTEKGTGKFKSSIDFVDFEFLERDEEIDEKDLDVPSLDQHLIVYTAEELTELLGDTTTKAKSDDEGGRGGRRERGERRERGDRDDDRGGRSRDRDDDRGGRSRDSERGGRSKDDDRGGRDRDEGRSSRSKDDDRPSRSRDRDDDRGGRSKEDDRGSRSRERDDDRPSRSKDEGRATEADPEEDTAPAPTAGAERRRPSETVITGDSRCPQGHGWGVNAVDKFPECSNCSKWSDCMEGA